MNDIIKICVGVIFCLLVLDFVAWMAWDASGQQPADGFYAGAITAQVLGAPK